MTFGLARPKETGYLLDVGGRQGFTFEQSGTHQVGNERISSSRKVPAEDK